MYEVFPPPLWLDADVLGGLGGLGDIKSIDGDVSGSADDDEPVRNRAIGLELWVVNFVMGFFLGGIVKDIGHYRCGR